jgi:hypothetical protein
VEKELRIDRPVVDVYSSANAQSERANQLLLNEVVRHLSTKGDFARVRGADGYVGWVRRDHLFKPVSARCSHLVDVPVASILDEQAELFAGKLSFGTRISMLEKNGSFGRIGFLGKPAWISLGCVKRLNAKKLRWRTLRTYLVSLVGTPYLWGGRSGFGLDCSGLVQLIYNSCGYDLPRDSIDQRKRGHRVSVKNLRPGDLIFSPGHVCVYYGSGRIVHSSARAGGVYVEDLLSGAPDSRSDIRSRIELIRRVI